MEDATLVTSWKSVKSFVFSSAHLTEIFSRSSNVSKGLWLEEPFVPMADDYTYLGTTSLNNSIFTRPCATGPIEMSKKTYVVKIRNY